MALELSARTYDWGPLRERGHTLVNILETVDEELRKDGFDENFVAVSPDENIHIHDAEDWSRMEDMAGYYAVEDLLVTTVEREWGGDFEEIPFSLSKLQQDDRTHQHTLNLARDDWRTYEFDLTVDHERARITSTFKVNPDFDDPRIVHDGDLANADFDQMCAIIDYYFEAYRRVFTVHTDTLLSEREREVAVLNDMGYDDETILDLMQIPRSNLTQYKTRIERHAREARATLDLLDGTELEE